MKFNKDDILEKIKDFSSIAAEKATNVFHAVTDFFSTHGAAAYAAAGSAAVLIIFLIILAFSSGDKKDSGSSASRGTAAYSSEAAAEELLNPEEPVYPDEYILSREPQSSWSEKDVQRWFSEPDLMLLNQLDDKNTKTIQKILEAAP